MSPESERMRSVSPRRSFGRDVAGTRPNEPSPYPPTGNDPTTVPAGIQALERVIERQRNENENLRSALRYRAVIEQAKGILMARSGVDPDTAFNQLVTHSQRQNLKLTYVAAHVVARAITAPSPVAARESLEVLEEVSDDGITLQLAAAALASAPDLNDLVQTVLGHAAPYGVTRCLLALQEPDGALRLVAWQGLELHRVSQWQRIPPGDAYPVAAAAHTRRPLWLLDPESRRRHFPSGDLHHQAGAALPLLVGSQLVGVLWLGWEHPVELDDATRQHLLDVAALCAVPVGQLQRHHELAPPELEVEPAYAQWFHALIDAIPSPIAVLDPELDGERVTDLTVLHANPAARADTGLHTKCSVAETRPDVVAHGLLTSAQQVLTTGNPILTPPLVSRAKDPERAAVPASLVRVGTALVISWIPLHGGDDTAG